MKNMALLFPGQGSQYVGMNTNICKKYSTARRTFEEANEALGFDLQALCDSGPVNELTMTINSQPAILVTSVANYRVFMEEVGVAPLYYAGHSLGEISALTCAGAIEFSDAVKLTRSRGQFMQEAVALGDGAMTAIIGVDPDTIAAVCQGISTTSDLVVISNYNAPNQIVISGHQAAVTKASEALVAMGAHIVPLKVSAPFHSPLMQSAAAKFNEELRQYRYHDPKYPVISNVNALPYTGKDQLIENLVTQLVQPVQWAASMAWLQSRGIEMVIEVGPGTVLRDLMKKNAPEIPAFSYDKEDEVEQILNKLELPRPALIAKAAKLKLITRCLAIVVCTQNRNWDNDAYQKGVVEPYQKARQLLDELESGGQEPSLDQMKVALEMLQQVFITKQTPIEEQVERFNQVFNETGTRSLFPDLTLPS
jgi:[acyl-carrier-protein] S-malonyltransferase